MDCYGLHKRSTLHEAPGDPQVMGHSSHHPIKPPQTHNIAPSQRRSPPLPVTVSPAVTDAMESPVGEMQDIVSRPIVRLEVGRGAYYTIKREILLRFRYFRALLLINPALAPKITVDANPDVFPHIITYLQRGTFPLTIDAQGRHHITTYLVILEEAKHFELDRLVRWIEEGRFAEAAKIECTTTIGRETDVDQVDHARLMTAIITEDGKIVSNISRECSPAWGKRLVYRCPRGLHNGDRARCGRKCNNALGDAAPSYDEIPTLRLLEVKKNLVIDPRLCRDPDW